MFTLKALVLITAALWELIPGELIRPDKSSIFKVKSITKSLPVSSGLVDYVITAVIETDGDLGQDFEGNIRLFPLNGKASPFEQEPGSGTLYRASVDVYNSNTVQDVGIDLTYRNESQLFSIKLDSLPLAVETNPTGFYNSIKYMIYNYFAPPGMRYAVDISPKIRAFRTFSMFSLRMEQIVGNTSVKVSNTSLYSSGFVSDRYAAITFDQAAMEADHVVIRKLQYTLMTWPEMERATGGASAQYMYQII